MRETLHAPFKSIAMQNTGSNHKNSGIEHSRTVNAKLTHKSLERNQISLLLDFTVRQYIVFTGNILYPIIISSQGHNPLRNTVIANFAWFINDSG